MDQIPALHLGGYFVIETEDEDFIGLRLQYRNEKGDVIKESGQIINWPDSSRYRVQRDRLRLLLEAMCRYRNTGDPAYGDLTSAADSFDELPDLHIDPNWNLWTTDVGEHIYANKDKSKFLRVVENEFTELLSPKECVEVLTGGQRFVSD